MFVRQMKLLPLNVPDMSYISRVENLPTQSVLFFLGILPRRVLNAFFHY